MRLPTRGETLESIARSRFAQAERLERELTAGDQRWSPAGHPFMRRWLDGELSADELRRYTGRYEMGPLALVIALEENGTLSALIEPGVSKGTLLPYRGTMFKLKEQDTVTVEFVLSGDTVEKVVIQPGGVFTPVR